MYKTTKYAVNIDIQLENGIYEFEPDYDIGKTRLCKLLKLYNAGGEPVISFTYSDKMNGVPFDSIVKPGKQKVLLLDRYDMYKNEYVEQILEFAKTGIVLVDAKTTNCLPSDFCTMEMQKRLIEVT